METSPEDGVNKRGLEETQGVSEGEVKEKRPRLESGISDISDVDFVVSNNYKENDVIVISSKSEEEEQSATEVIYELSPDNDESLLSISASPTAQGDSPNKEKEDNEQEEVVDKPVSDHENLSDEIVSEKEEIEEGKVKENEEEESSGSEASGESSSSSSSDEENNDDVTKVHEDSEDNEDNEDIRDSKDFNIRDNKGRKARDEDSEDNEDPEDIKNSKNQDMMDNKGRKVHEDSEDSEEPEDIKDNKDDKVRDNKTRKDDREMISEGESASVAEKEEKHAAKKTQKTVQETIHSEEEHSSESSDEGEMKAQKRQKKPVDVVDGKDFFEQSDYSKKSVEDLEDLQEDLHKELAEISEMSLEKKKHKKTSSSSRREKRHKEKSSSRYREEGKERSREQGHYSKDNKGRHKHRDFDEKPWSYESRRGKTEKEERRDRGEKSSWTHGRAEHSPKRLATKGSTHRDGVESRGPKQETVIVESKDTTGEGRKNGAKKGPISDSLREMIRAGVKEIKSDGPKDMRGFSTEVIDYESDESVERLDILKDEMSDVSQPSSSSESEDESSPEVPKLPPYLPAIQGCRNVEEFQWLNRIEEGTYGVVYRAKDKRSGEIVALKKLKMEKEKEGFPITSLREINTLLKSQHPNIVGVQEIVVGNNMDKIYIVMDFVEHDLKALMETMTQAFLGGEIKTIMIQLLRAVNHLHDNWILHRDIKTSNLLLSNKGILKVGDFGLAREYGSPLKPYTPIVVTLWYRAPELLLGAKEYSTPIDLWSVGCVFAELLTMKPLFNGQSEISQINKIFKELGTPSDKIWPGPPAYSEYPATKKMTFAEYPYNNLRNRFGATLTDKGFELLNSFLTYDPKRRITAAVALKHPYFDESPLPVDPSMFPSWPARSEGAKRAKKASPKAPEGGNFYQTLSGDGDGAFHIPAGKSQGSSAVSSFTLKF